MSGLGPAVSALVRDPRYFAQVSFASCEHVPVPSEDPAVDAVKDSVWNMLGTGFNLQNTASGSQLDPTGLFLYDTLSQILPFSSQTAFYWKTVGYPLASMMDTANYPQESQIKLLTFVYARLLGFMGREDQSKAHLATDGSSAELSWSIPSQAGSNGEGRDIKVRFAIELMHPTDGTYLSGRDVLTYLTSTEGGLGVVYCPEGSMKWMDIVQEFLNPASTDGAQEGAVDRVGIGFDLSSTGKVAMKIYIFLKHRPTITGMPLGSEPPVYFLDTDFRPLRSLVAKLGPGMPNALEQMLDYFDTFNGAYKPRLGFLAVDLVPASKNRLKVYFETIKGTSFSHVQEFLELGGRNGSGDAPQMLEWFRIFWDILFPEATVSSGREITDIFHRSAYNVNSNKHLSGGIGWYFELGYGQERVNPKIYLSVRDYCKDDQQIAHAVEEFYEKVGVRGFRGDTAKGWYERSVSRAFKQRPLEAHTGIHTYLTFASKKSGWELIHYFSPEIWVWLQKEKSELTVAATASKARVDQVPLFWRIVWWTARVVTPLRWVRALGWIVGTRQKPALKS